MLAMFHNAINFNQDISNWNTSNVSNMRRMFYEANNFNQDLSDWCVSKIGSKPNSFDASAIAWTDPKPSWGNCH
ncbi:BspA family leucine-rich repeat surface protein [Marinobacter sp. LV10R510-11A]|uniref:BspA family leucine-rich repeat surface protein n=1 Tax=Marinobacter sp. LV10R510-11A TaxID=1415568 RepID=UPI0018D544BB